MLAFGLFATEDLKINDGVKIRPWRMGAGGDLRMGVGSTANAYAFVRGNASWGRASGVFGDMRLGGNLSIQEGGSVRGAVIPDPVEDLPTLAWSPFSVPADSSVVIESGHTRVMSSSSFYPKDVTVRSNGTLTLYGGIFQFRSLVLNAGAQLILRPSYATGSNRTPFRIDVSQELIVDHATMIGDRVPTRTDSLDGRWVLWRYGGSSEIHLDGATRFLGTLAAPWAKVSLSSSSRFQGSIWARQVELHQYHGAIGFLPYVGNLSGYGSDSDFDGIDDTTEFRYGTDPLSQDTDGDGYSDGLEIVGRVDAAGVRWLGADLGVSAEPSHYSHSWGWALDTTRRDLFNPLRRDQFLRLVWQDSSEMAQMATDSQMVWDSTSQSCSLQPTYAPSAWGNFREAWMDSAYLDHFVSVFADTSDKPLVDAPHLARVPDYTVTMHLDAGPGATRNLPNGLPLFGGEVLTRGAGVGQGRGPYQLDLDGDGRFNAKDSLIDGFDCSGNPIQTQTLAERTPLLQNLFSGWSGDLFRDCWVLAIGFGANPRDWATEKATTSDHVYIPAQVQNTWSLRKTLLHEYGHAIGLTHPRWYDSLARVWRNFGFSMLADGVMNYAYLGWYYQRCSPVSGATWGNTRWCGPHPPRNPDGWFMNWYPDQSTLWFSVNWWRNDIAGRSSLNQAATLNDTLLAWEAGPLDPRTGFRRPRTEVSMEDIHFSRGLYCPLKLDSLVESEGISLCRTPHGDTLPFQQSGTPIDWNQNGVIDAGYVDLWGQNGENGVPWFLAPSSVDTIPASQSLPSRIQYDENDWVTWMQETDPFIGVAGNRVVFQVKISQNPYDLKRMAIW
ncbi:MAG: hypothetical protein H6686_09045 [Fibrobacteria bacterium]|nr:hypothetical protein [Fibrobacteria bacterium]